MREVQADAMVGDDGQVLLVLGDLRDGGAHGGAHLRVLALQQVYDELEAAHERAHQLARVLHALREFIFTINVLLLEGKQD